MYPAYWIAATALIGAALLGVPLGQPAAVAGATLVFIGGGLPHGAYDIALLRRSVALGRSGMGLAVGGYAAIALLMVVLWMTVPLVALVLFLAVASVHFGEDWQMLEEPLLRFAAGAAVIAAATIGHPAEVSALFVAMSDPRAAVIAQIITAAAPVALLVTAIGIAAAWRDGSRHWAAAMALCFALLLVLPPVAGFALFFVFLHSPRHLAQTRVVLRDMTLGRWLGTGALLSSLAILGWCTVRAIAPWRFEPIIVAQAFQLLASVAVPHLMLSRWLEGRLSAAPSSEEKTLTA
ncbi:Brp/Blh family beta-carotene 15,15'-dioxygenase [Sphingomonas glacialis]|uniref:Brp/Blh family beta-carotene 15,15'-dioxygenase n=1 Tax=Sphingomonas glacialis TaxID=658225 RepID=UPI001F4FF572|nr:Brp/Blh family beta-carotene 15,15'-dioxygenase [Sphingomonas glacialis]